MDSIERKSIAFDQEQLKEFDSLIKRMGYKNRSEAIRDLMRDFLSETKRIHNKDLVSMGTLSFLYDHHASNIQADLSNIQHKHKIVHSSTHVHLESGECMEVLILKGKVAAMDKLSAEILSMKGVKHGRFVLTGPFLNVKK